MESLYIVVELQKSGNQLGNIVNSYDTLANAQHKFYTVAAAASISNIEQHSVVLLDDRGFLIDRISFEHPAE